MTLKFNEWSQKTIRHLFYTTSNFVHHFKSIGVLNWSYSLEMLNSGKNWRFFVPRDLEIWWMTLKNNSAPLLYYINWSYLPETAKWGHDLCDLDLWPLTLTFCMDIMSVNGNNSWKISWWYDDRNIVKKIWQTDRETDTQADGQMEISVLRAAWLQLKIMGCNYLIHSRIWDKLKIVEKWSTMISLPWSCIWE